MATINSEISTICPFCAEGIKSEAVICKHCGKKLPARLNKKIKWSLIGLAVLLIANVGLGYLLVNFWTESNLLSNELSLLKKDFSILETDFDNLSESYEKISSDYNYLEEDYDVLEGKFQAIYKDKKNIETELTNINYDLFIAEKLLDCSKKIQNISSLNNSIVSATLEKWVTSSSDKVIRRNVGVT